jgi:hypothetical protein
MTEVREGLRANVLAPRPLRGMQSDGVVFKVIESTDTAHAKANH